MDLDNTHASFEATSWTLIDALKSHGYTDAMERLTRANWPPIYAFIRHKGYSSDDSLDLTQQFFTEKILERGLFQRAERARGRLRSLLCKSVENFLINQHTRAASKGRRLEVSLEQIETEESLIGSGDGLSSVDAFDRRWSLSLVHRAMEQVERDLRREGREGHWLAFEDHHILAQRNGGDGTPYEELARQLGFKTRACVAAAVQVVRKRMADTLRIEVVQTIPGATPEEVDQELALVKGSLGIGANGRA